jgi:RNA polymerase sigma-70 factor (ECF subfamily)
MLSVCEAGTCAVPASVPAFSSAQINWGRAGHCTMSELVDTRTFFGQSIEECLDPLYGVALRLTRNSEDAEDLVAEAVAKAWSAIDSLEDRRRFRSWLFRILHNHFVTDYRKKSIRPREEPIEELFVDEGEGEVVSILDEQPDEFLKWWATPEKALINKLLGEQIMAAIDALPEAFRVTILLVNVEGLGYDEAAEVLGVPSGTVRSRMKRGRTLLQKALWQQAKDAGLTAADGMDGTRA